MSFHQCKEHEKKALIDKSYKKIIFALNLDE
jgi:hypothetical protein